MKGIVLGYDAETETVVLRADSGRRYRFQGSDWRERGSPRKGDPVDFEPDGDRARDVFLVAPARIVEPGAPVAPVSVVAEWAPARFFLERPVFSFALLVLLACLTGAYAVGEVRISLIQVPDLISRMSESLDSLIAVSGTDPSPRIAAGFVRLLLVLLLGLYAVPALAAYVAWREFVGRPDRRLARYAGIAAIVLPIALPFLIAIVVQAWVLPGIPDAGARLGRAGVTTPQQVFEVLRLYATGTVLLILAGLGLWASATGRFAVPVGQRTVDEPVLEPLRQRSTSRAAAFIPFRKKKAAAKSPAKPPEPAPVAASEPISKAAPTPQPSPPVPFLRKTAGKQQAAAPASEEAALPADDRQSETIDDAIRSVLETDALADKPSPPKQPPGAMDLPPRGGSVWPEPVEALVRRAADLEGKTAPPQRAPEVSASDDTGRETGPGSGQSDDTAAQKR